MTDIKLATGTEPIPAETTTGPDLPSLVDDEARDSIHIMPLSIVPLKTAGLRQARLVKNAQLETMVELFHGKDTGSGQIPTHLLARAFPSDLESLALDQPVIERLRALPSFDVYSLRIALRRLDIGIENETGLSLSEKKRAELSDYMATFTRPLIHYVYGDSLGAQAKDIGDILERLRTPDRAEARKRLDELSQRLDVPPAELPRFLEDYGDIFLSLAYFRRILDRLVPETDHFLAWADGVKDSEVIRHDTDTMALLDNVKTQLSGIVTSITGRFETFDAQSKALWSEMTAANFRAFREMVIANHSSIGSVLCGLTLKMDHWTESFPDRGGGPSRRADFLRNQMYQGLSRLAQEEKMAARRLR